MARCVQSIRPHTSLVDMNVLTFGCVRLARFCVAVAQSYSFVQDIMAAGGMESMSNVPYIIRSARAGAGYGHQTMEVIPSLLVLFRLIYSFLFFFFFSAIARS